MHVHAAIALGSNLPSPAGDGPATLTAACAEIERLAGVRVLRVSDFVRTAPVGGVSQQDYTNGAATIETRLPAPELLQQLLAVELRYGRNRAQETRWGPRTLDLDLLLYGEIMIDEPGLRVPHPRMHERLFVLEPLSQIAPEWVIPTLGVSVRQCCERVRRGQAGESAGE